MGNQSSEYFDKTGGAILWEKFDTRNFYLQVSSPSFSISTDLFQQIDENPFKSHIFSLFLQKIVEKWQNDYFVSGLLHLLKHYMIHLYFNKYPFYSFIFQKPVEVPQALPQPLTSRSVACSFTYKSLKKLIYLQIPSTTSDPATENNRLLSIVQSNFPEVSKKVTETSRKVILLNSENEIIQIEDIQKFYSEFDDNVLIEPFEEEKKHLGHLMEIRVKTVEFELDSPLRQFIEFVVENMSKVKLGLYTIKTHAVFEFILAGLASQLYDLSGTGAVVYKDFKRSPLLNFLMDLDKSKGKLFAVRLLEYCNEFSEPEKKFSYFSSLFASELDLKIAAIEEQAPKQALLLFLLLNSYAVQENPYKIENLELDWGVYLAYLKKCTKSVPILLLFSNLTSRNPSLLTKLLQTSNMESFLEPLLGELYSPIKFSFRIDVILIILLKLSENNSFVQQTFKSQNLKNVTWIKDYVVEEISLGSMIFFVITKLLKQNFKEKKLEHIQVYCIGILFNLSQSAANLHNIPSYEFLNFLKGLYSSYCICLKTDPGLAENIKYFMQLLIDIICKILQQGLSQNSNLVLVMLSENELFKKMRNSEIGNHCLEEISNCLKNILMFIKKDENKEEGVKTACQLQKFEEADLEILSVKSFKFFEDPGKWEEFVVPYIWSEISNETFVLQVDEMQAIFEVELT